MDGYLTRFLSLGFTVEVLTPDEQVPKIRFPWKIALHKSVMLLLLILVGLFSAGIMAEVPPVQAGSGSVAEVSFMYFTTNGHYRKLALII